MIFKDAFGDDCEFIEGDSVYTGPMLMLDGDKGVAICRETAVEVRAVLDEFILGGVLRKPLGGYVALCRNNPEAAASALLKRDKRITGLRKRCIDLTRQLNERPSWRRS